MSSERAEEPAGAAFFYCFAAFVLLAPLYKAGNRPLPLLLLELAAIGFLFVIVAMHRGPLALPRLLAAAIGLLLVYPLLQLIPLPGALWRMLPGHAEYAAVLEHFAAPGAAGAWRPLSIIPVKTEYGWLALLPPLACFLAAMRLSREHAARLLLIMVAFAGAESLLGLAQVGAGGDSVFEPRAGVERGVASGTFANRDHLAAMLAMMLPVTVGLLVYGPLSRLHRPGHPVAAAASEAAAKRALLFASAVMILVCVAFTRSRAGLSLGLVGLFTSGIVLARARIAGEGEARMRAASIIVTALVVLAAIATVVIGAERVIGGFESGALHTAASGRMAVCVATFRGAIDFLPFGSGLSTFEFVFPRFETSNSSGGFEYAHNDYVQAFLELGVVAPMVVGLLLVAYASRMRRLLRVDGGSRFPLLQLGAGLGLLPMMLHSLFDFPLHMPANAMWFATLAGILFRGRVEPAGEVGGQRIEIRRPPQNRAPSR